VYPLRSVESNSMTSARNHGIEIGLAVFWSLTYSNYLS